MKFDIFNLKRVFIIAELSANHNGNLETAIDSVKAIKKSGADAIKLQTYTADTITIDSNNDDFQIKHDSIWDGQTLHNLYKKAFTPWEWHEAIFKAAKDEDLICFSSPFDNSAVDFLEQLNCPIYKVASPEITDIPLIEYIASKGKPIILSTGIADLSDIELALSVCKKAGNNQIALLKCTSSYPAPVEEANLRMIPEFKNRFSVVPGLSDHTIGSTVPLVAVALGAKIIEKHFIIDRSIGGPDASFSMNENEFKSMVNGIRDAEKSLGNVTYELTEKQLKSRDFRRSLYVVENINKGEILTKKNVRSIRPGFGMHPKNLPLVLGKQVSKNIIKGSRLNKDDIIDFN
jgi:pseudaminic acid synthase